MADLLLIDGIRLGLHSMSRPTTMGFPAYMERISCTHSSTMAALSVRVVSMVFPAKLTEYLEVLGLKVIVLLGFIMIMSSV